MQIASNNQNVQALCTTKMTIFHFRENNFASYDESDVSKRFSRRFRTVLPLRSCLYDASISSYRRSKFWRYNTTCRINSTRPSTSEERCAYEAPSCI